MAVFSVVRVGDLAPGLVIAAERYHPARLLRADEGGLTVGELAALAAELVSPGGDRGPCLVLDTSDATGGFIGGGKALVAPRELGSVKKLVRPGDVLISRLRPYLRQVATCDAGLAAPEVIIVCSTEFLVLHPRTDESIAFLVPYLLSPGPQRALAAAVEGGHHPRFGKEVLLGLPVPRAMLEARQEISRQVVEAARHRRESERLMASAIGRVAPA